MCIIVYLYFRFAFGESIKNVEFYFKLVNGGLQLPNTTTK